MNDRIPQTEPARSTSWPGTPIDDLRGANTLVAIGNFDGVHVGHRSVLMQAAAVAAERGLVPVVLTFEPHPTLAVGRPSPAGLTPIERKVELIQRLSPTLRVVVLHFDAAFAAQTPELFVRDVLVHQLRAKIVRVGDNFRFGAGRRGDLQTLRLLGESHGFDVHASDLVVDGEGRYSSTRIRSLIASGDLAHARKILGRPHAVSGTVVEGQRRARHLGFPTANLAWVPEAIPPHGVHAVAVDLIHEDGVARRLGVGVANIGVRPTVDAGFAVETHVFDRTDDLYGRRLRVHLIQHLRQELKFSGIDALREQIARDCSAARQCLRELAPADDASEAWF